MVTRVAVVGACLGVGITCFLTPQKASAWEALQLTLNATAVSYQKTSFTNDAEFASSGSSGLSGSSASATTSTTGVGLIGQGFGTGVGYAWNHILLGARAEAWSDSTSNGDGGAKDENSTVALLPRVEYIFDPGHTSPYLAAILGIEHDSATRTVGTQPSAPTVQSGTDFLYGAAFGLHAFIAPVVSIDPELAVVGGSGSLSQTTGGVEDTFSESSVRVMLTLGLSAWLGAQEDAPPPPAGAFVVPPFTVSPAPPPPPVEPDADEVKPLFTNIHLPGHRRLYLQVSQDPAHTALIIRLSEARDEAALAACNNISVPDGAGALPMRVQSHGAHFVAGVIAPHAVELLASSDALISVCGAQWTLGTESREELQTFLKDRRDLQPEGDDSGEPAASPAVPASPAIPAPPSAPLAPSK